MVSHKYSRNSVDEVKTDIKSNHGISLCRGYIQRIAEMVGLLVTAKEENWSYSIPSLDSPVSTISIGLDGTTMLMHKDGYRQAMVGTIGLYDKIRRTAIYALYWRHAGVWEKQIFKAHENRN